MPPLDLNTILISILLALSGWTLYTLHGLAKNDAARAQKDEGQDQQIRENRARIVAMEGDVGDLKVQVGRLEERSGLAPFRGK